MSRPLQAGLIFASIVLPSAALIQPAAARILCDGEFQIARYGRIATPYCGDQVIARVRPGDPNNNLAHINLTSVFRN